MGIVQKDGFRTMIISYLGMGVGYLNKGLLFLIILTPEQMGLIFLLTTIGTLFAQLSSMGMMATIWRFFPFFKNESNNDHGFLSFSLLLTIAGMTIVTLLSILFRSQIEAYYIEKSPLFVDYYFWFIPIGTFYILYQIFDTYLRAMYKNIVSVISYEIFLRLGVLVSLLLFWYEWIDFSTLVIINSLVYAIPCLILVVYIIKLKGGQFLLSSIAISKRFRKIIFNFSMFNYVNYLGSILVTSLDVIMIAQLIGLDGTGVYTFVIFMTSAMLIPYRSMIRVSSPLVAEHWKNRDTEKLAQLYSNFSSVSLVIGLGLFLIVWLNIDFLFNLIPDDKWEAFQPGIWVFLFLMIGRLLDMYTGLNGAIFVTSKKYKYNIYFTIGLVIVVYFGNLIMIPEWGIAGAAISTAIALTVFNIGRLIFVWKVYRIHPFQMNQLMIILLGGLTLGASFLIHPFILNPILGVLVQLAIILIVYCAPIYLFNIEHNTVQYIKNGVAFVKKKIGVKN